MTGHAGGSELPLVASPRPMILNCSKLYSGCDLFGGHCICLEDVPDCQNPFAYSTREECEQAAGTASPDWNQGKVKGYACI